MDLSFLTIRFISYNFLLLFRKYNRAFRNIFANRVILPRRPADVKSLRRGFFSQFCLNRTGFPPIFGMSVSYTHLDVYKRQEPICGFGGPYLGL